MLEKAFDPKTAEPRLYREWEASGAFMPCANPAAPVFSMAIPPPNITGALHIGHALNCTLQDVLARFARMRGAAVLWLPGTDHAGIATQMVVERQLAAEGNIGRRDLGRLFVRRRDGRACEIILRLRRRRRSRRRMARQGNDDDHEQAQPDHGASGSGRPPGRNHRRRGCDAHGRRRHDVQRHGSRRLGQILEDRSLDELGLLGVLLDGDHRRR